MDNPTPISDKWRVLINSALEIYSIKGLAELLEVDRSAIQRYRDYGALPDVVKLDRYCRLLGTDLSALATGSCNEGDARLFKRRDVTSEALALPIEDRKKLLVEVAKSL